MCRRTIYYIFRHLADSITGRAVPLRICSGGSSLTLGKSCTVFQLIFRWFLQQCLSADVFKRGGDFMRKMRSESVVLYVAFLIFAVSAGFGNQATADSRSGVSGYRVSKKYKLGGQGGWDYLAFDSPKHRLFITRGTHVMVIDTTTGSVAGDIPGLRRGHGVALAAEFNKGFISDGTGSVVIFDYTTLQALGTAKTDKDCDGIIFDPASKRVFATNGDAGTSTAIEASTGKVAGTFPLGGKPEFEAADGKGYVFANLEDKSSIVKINAQTLKVEETWPLAPCESPSGLAIDAADERLIVGCRNQLMAFVDGNSGKVIGTVPIGQGVDANRFDPGTGSAFASCGDGTITVAHEDSPDKFSLVGVITTQRGARTMEIDPSTHTLYTVSAEFGPAPEAAADNPHPRPTIVPDTFTLLVVSP
jgi:DNA-binding beta-propeller fold protein YncE